MHANMDATENYLLAHRKFRNSIVQQNNGEPDKWHVGPT